MGSPNLIPVGVTLDDLRRAVRKLASLRLNADSTPTFASQTISGLTANRLIASNASQVLVSSDLYSWVTETSNQVLIADDGDGTITFSTPQNIHTGATPTFASVYASNTIGVGVAPQSNKLINVMMSESDAYGVFVDGETTPYTGTGFTHTFRGRRYWDWESEEIVREMIGNLFLVQFDSTLATLDSSAKVLNCFNITSYLKGVIANSGTTNRVFDANASFQELSDDGTYDSQDTGVMTRRNRGTSISVADNSTWTDTGETGHNNINQNTAFYAKIESAPTLTSGNLYTFNAGFRCSITGTTTGSSWNYGIRIDSVTGADVNYGIYDASGANWSLNSDNQKLFFGGARDASIYYDNTDLIINPQEVGSGRLSVLGELALSSIANEATDVDKFLVDSSGVIKYRTGSELLSDLELPSNANGEGASLIGIEDATSLYTATNVEAALAEVMDQITIVTHVANSVTMDVGSATGSVSDTQTINDSNEYNIHETTGPPNPNFVSTFDFSGITAGHEPNLIELHWGYNGGAGHIIELQMYNYDTTNWDVIDNTTLTDNAGTLLFNTFTITDGGGAIVDYTSGGAARVRFSHAANGIAAHDFLIDYLAIKDDHGIGSGITDHGSLSGLSDDDHLQYHTDARAVTWLAANHETTYTHADIASNTTHRGLSSGNPHNVTPAELSLTIGTNTQAWDAGLDSLAGLTYAAASFVKMTGANTFALRTIGETADDLEGTIVHDNLASIPANDHIDHTGVTLTAGLGLTGSGDISASRTFDMDIAGLTEDTAPQATADYVATYDNSASTHKKVLVEDLGPFGSVTRSQTINLLQADSAAQMQTKIDALGKYIPADQTIVFQFETGGTHTLDTEITFSGFFGEGVVVIQGNTGEAGAETKHTTQDTILNFNNDTNGLDILSTEVYMHVRNLKIIVESDVVDTKCVNADIGNRVEVSWNYFVGNATGKGRGFSARYCRYARSYQCLIDNLKYGLTSSGSRLHAWDNDDTGTPPLYGLWANQISYIGKQSTQISGSTADELVDAGSQII